MKNSCNCRDVGGSRPDILHAFHAPLPGSELIHSIGCSPPLQTTIVQNQRTFSYHYLFKKKLFTLIWTAETPNATELKGLQAVLRVPCFTFDSMISSTSPPISENFKNAVGLAGNIFAFGLFVSPIPTFRRIIRNRSTEQFSGLPYVYALFNCLICLWYGMPLVSPDNIMITSVNSVGAVFQLVYLVLFMSYADKPKKLRTLRSVLIVIVLFTVIIVGSLYIVDRSMRQMFVGLLSVVSLVSMFASPLFIIRLVMRMRSVEFMPFYLSLLMFLMSTSFFLYGILNYDAFVSVPNAIGTCLGIVQLALHCYYVNRTSEEDSSESLGLIDK